MSDYLKESQKYTRLLELYGNLLTERKRSILEDYYLYNLSLTEISEEFSITRQAVLDAIKASEKKLNEIEEKLNFLKLGDEIVKLLDEIEVKSELDRENIEKIKKLL